MKTPELKTAILRLAGKGEFYGYEIHKKLEQRKITVGIGRLYSVLSEMKDDGLLKDRWEKSQNGPKRRVYRTGRKGDDAREKILLNAIKTVHEFYTEYLLSLPPKLSVFNMVSDLLIEKLPKKANLAYAATRFSGPVKKLIENLQQEFPDGNLYAIHSKENNTNLDLGKVSVLDGTFEDIPMKDDYLDLLAVTGNIRSDCIDSCLREWHRVLTGKGTLAIVAPTAVITKYKDPLGIGEFIEQREHPRLESAESFDVDILTSKMRKYFEKVDVKQVVHITVLRGFKPISIN